MTDEQRDRFLSDRANFGEAHARALVTGDGASALQLRSLPGSSHGRDRGRRPRLVCEGCREPRLARWYSRGPRLGARAHCALRQSHRRVRSSSELARRSRRALRRSRGRARERRRNRGAMRHRAINRKLRSAQSSSPNSSRRSRSPSMTPIQPLPRRELEPRRRLKSALAWALLGRAVEENDRAAAERSRAFFAARADAAASGDAGGTGGVAARPCLQPVRARGLLGGHRNGATRTEEAPRAGGHARDGDRKGAGSSLHHRDLVYAAEATPAPASASSPPLAACTASTACPRRLLSERFSAVSRKAHGRL